MTPALRAGVIRESTKREESTMLTGSSLARSTKTLAILASLLTVVAVTATPVPLGASTPIQRCVAPPRVDQAGRQTISPGINAHAAAQKITAKLNLAQCSNAKATGGSGTLRTSMKTTAITCAAFTTAHVWDATAKITWTNKSTSTATLAFATSGVSRLADVTGTISAGVFAGHSVTAQFKWKPVISPAQKKFSDACANTSAPGEAGRISVVGHIVFRTKAFTIH